MRITRWKLSLYAAIIIAGLAALVPNLLTPAQLSGLPQWVSRHQITLGLDLRGGSHLVLEVDARALIAERLESLGDDARARLRDAGVSGARVKLAGEAVVVTLAEPAQAAAATRALASLDQAVGIGAVSALDIVADGARQIRIALTEAGQRERIDTALTQSLEVVRHRIDEIGVAEPTVQRVGSDRILVQLPGVQDPARIKALLGSTAKMSFHRVALAGDADRAVKVLPSKDGGDLPVERRATLTGDHLVEAAPGFDQTTGEAIVTFRFDTAGARVFARFTQANVGQPFAIVMDEKVLSAPVIREPILGGSGQISGRFTVQEASDLAAMLRAGALPAPLTVIEERTVGAAVGADAIKMGAWSGLAGFALVVAFMLGVYGRWGAVASLALTLNIGLTLGALSWLGATLTLPGIAGIVLGIGMAVDANVLINERIREESRRGVSALAALDIGFRRAYATIVDANVTTLIATSLLFTFGAGPVRGFAITMGLGILISMFTAVAVVRVIMEWAVRRSRIRSLEIAGPLRFVPEGTGFRFMRARFIGLGLSLALSVASLALFFSPGLNYGIDFRGGTQIEVQSSAPIELATAREKLAGLGLGEIALQRFGAEDTLLVRAQQQEGGERAQTAAVERIKQAVVEIAPDAEFKRVEMVGPKVSGELALAGIIAVAFAALSMLAYIWFRFEWPFAVGAIATLVLDLTKTVGFFVVTGLDFNLPAIAALLTIIGYSVNDKVVVYDRMRENLRLYKRASLREIIDLSINASLPRTIYTSATTFLALLPMALFGGSAVASFAWPMLFGVVLATSSSIFIAAPILLLLGDWRKRRTDAREEAQIGEPGEPSGGEVAAR